MGEVSNRSTCRAKISPFFHPGRFGQPPHGLRAAGWPEAPTIGVSSSAKSAGA